MNKQIMNLAFFTVLVLLLSGCGGLKVGTDVNLGPDTLARIDKVNDTLSQGIQVAPETRDTIEELNETIRQGIKVGFDSQTLIRVDELLRIVEDDLEIGLDDDTLNTVNGLIEVIDKAPDKWQITGEKIITELEKAAGTTSKQMADEIKGVIDKTLSDSEIFVSTMGIEFRCNVDFLSARAGETLDKFIGRTIVGMLRDIISGKKASEIPPTPWVCQILPERIDLIRQGEKLITKSYIISITGFNLQNLDPSISVLDELNNEVDSIQLPLPVVNSSYQIQLNLQGINFSEAPLRSKISFRWPDVINRTEISIILPEEDVPTAEFTANPKDGVYPLSVQFNDQSKGEVSGWKWEFGDGETSEEQHPIHTYERAGTFTVSLVASNNQGESIPKEKIGYIIVATPKPQPVADFEADPSTGIVPLTIRFKDQSSGNPNEWKWDFGDGSTSREHDPVHIYNEANTYIVKLEVINDQGSDEIEKTIIVNPEPDVYHPGAFKVKRYSFFGGNYKTNLDTDTYYCGIFGYHAHGISTDWILKLFMQDQPLQVFTRRTPDGFWEIIASPYGTGSLNVKWDIDLLCVGMENQSAFITTTLPSQGEWQKGGSVAMIIKDPDTGIEVPAEDHICGVVGLRFRAPSFDGGSIQSDGGNQGNNLKVDSIGMILNYYPFIENGVWKIEPDIYLETNEDTWQVDILCLKKDNNLVYELSTDQDPLTLDFNVTNLQTTIPSAGGRFSPLVCGVIGFKSTQQNNQLYKVFYNDPYEGVVVSGSQNPCITNDCTIIESRMFLPPDQNWNINTQVMWGEVRIFPDILEKDIPGWCGGHGDCDFGTYKVTVYKYYFPQISSTIKPLCIYTSLIEKMSSAPLVLP